MQKLTTTNYPATPGLTYGEWCWRRGLTPEYRAFIEDASDDWVLNTYRLIAGRGVDRNLSAAEDIECIALMHRAKMLGIEV